MLLEILESEPKGKLFKKLSPSERPAYFPVRILNLLGLQIEDETKALLKTNPFDAKLSIMGV